MSDDQDKADAAQEAPEDAEPKCGEVLANARREQQISVLEVAKELHIEEPKVRALEANDFAELGAPVFAKGHLRKYAQLVDVDEDGIMADYYALTRADGMPPIVSGRPRIRQELSPGPWIILVVVLVVVATGYWWFGVRSTRAPAEPAEPAESVTEPAGAESAAAVAADEPADAEPAAQEPAAQEPAAVPAEEADEAPTAPAGPAGAAQTDVATPGQAVAEPATSAEDAAAAPVAAGQLRLTLRFTGDCWTEITDAEGRRLFFNMGRDGQVVDASGTAPIAVLFGNGDNVSLDVNGARYALPASNAANRTVRLTLR